MALGGVVLPFLGGVGIGYAFDLELSESLFLGAILTATSVSISADTLKELGLLQSKEGTTILAAAVIDDIMGVVVLSFVFAVTGDGDPVVSLGKMALFLPLSLLVGWFITSRSAGKIEEHLSTETQTVCGDIRSAGLCMGSRAPGRRRVRDRRVHGGAAALAHTAGAQHYERP